MKKLFLKTTLLLLFLTLGFSSCVNLKNVNDFSSSSLKSIKNFEALDCSFKQICLDNCQDEKINALLLNQTACDCKTNEKADSITFLIYTAVKGYLDGLTNLSNNNFINYKIDPLTKALTKSDFAAIKIEKSQVEAYSNISNLLLNAFTNKYRKHKIKEFVKAGNGPLQVLISFLDFNLSANLAGKLNVQKQGIKDNYFELTKDQTLSSFEKRKAVEEYYQRSDKIEAKCTALTTYAKALKKIAVGHQTLADNIDRMNIYEIKEQLTQDASDIQDIISEFNKLAK